MDLFRDLSNIKDLGIAEERDLRNLRKESQKALRIQ